jgi:hypothetical protein
VTKVNKWILMAVGLVYGFFFLLTSLGSHFDLLGVPTLEPKFADLRLVTSASDCAQNAEWSFDKDFCDPWGRPFNYPSLWVKIFSTLGIQQSHTFIIGMLQIFLLSAAFFWWCWFVFRESTTIVERVSLIVAAGLVLTSPPILLLLERGNVDCWIFLGLTFVVVPLINGRFAVPVFILGSLGALKIYPFASMILFFKIRLSAWKLMFLCTVLGAACFSFYGEWHYILSRSITTWNSISYGSSMIPLMLFQIFGVPDSKPLATALGWLFFLVLVFLIRFFLLDFTTNFKTALGEKLNLLFPITIFGSAFLFTYLIGTSYDLRLVLLLPVFLSLGVLLRTKLQRIFLIGIIFIIMYGGQYTSGFGKFGLLLNMVSDVFLMLFSAFLFVLISSNIFQIKNKFNPEPQRH